MKNLPLGIQTFKNIIEEDYIYVDKTKDIYELLAYKGKYFFLSRPRRFGKSLLVTTLKEIFSGNKELFKGLWIYNKIKWQKYPVIRLDFSSLSFETPEKLRINLGSRISEFADDFKISIDNNRDYKDKFRKLIKKLSEKEKVVVLIDEYDKPIIDFIDNPEIALENRTILKNFYETLKSSEEYIKFVFITGVSKFSRVSVFSGLNNLTDITLDEKFATMLGYTESELFSYFEKHIKATAKKLNVTEDKLKYEIKNWYNGYSWDGKNFVYNPYSILSMFYHKEINNYWFMSGTPTFLIKLIKEYNIDIKSLENYETKKDIFETYDIDKMKVESLLFQTGYLTIKNVIEHSIAFRDYILNYPNLEVKESLLKNILDNISESKIDNEVIIGKMARSLENKDLEVFFTILKSLFASIPSSLFIKDKEAYYHTIIYLVLTLIGVRISVEVHTNKGRIDAVIETEKNIFVFEFKIGSSKKAINQIEEKKYYEKYLSDKKEILLIGVNFSIRSRNIKDFLVKNI